MGIDYAWEKFFSALHYAVASMDTLQERLANVISDVSHLQSDTFPNPDIWAEFEELIWKTTKLPARDADEGTIRETTAQMTDIDAADCLRKALGLFSEIAKLSS